MTREEFEKMDFESIMYQLSEERDDVVSYQYLIDFCIDRVQKYDMVNLAAHIFKYMADDFGYYSDWYIYDLSSGTCQKPVGINSKNDLLEFIDFE